MELMRSLKNKRQGTEHCIVLMDVKIVCKDRKVWKGLVNCVGGFNYISFAFFSSFVLFFSLAY